MRASIEGCCRVQNRLASCVEYWSIGVLYKCGVQWRRLLNSTMWEEQWRSIIVIELPNIMSSLANRFKYLSSDYSDYTYTSTHTHTHIPTYIHGVRLNRVRCTYILIVYPNMGLLLTLNILCLPSLLWRTSMFFR